MFILSRENFLNISGINHLNKDSTKHFGMNTTDIELSLQPVAKDKVKTDQFFFFFNPTLKLRNKHSGDKEQSR